MGAVINMATGNGVNVCKYKTSDTPETPRESLEPDGRCGHYGHWETVNVCRYNASDTPKIPKETFQSDKRWTHYNHWEQNKNV